MPTKHGSLPIGYNWLVANALPYQGEDCLIWPFCKAQCGYGTFMIEGRTWYSHRWICQQINGEPPTGKHMAAHKCGNKACVNPKHLSWKTNGENQLDRREHGTAHRKRRKLTPDNVAEIRRLEGIESRVSLAARFKVNEATIRQIQYGTIWKTGQITFKGKPVRGSISYPPTESK